MSKDYHDIVRKLIDKVQKSGNEIFWHGPATEEQIVLLENYLKFPLSDSFKDFLKTYGGGGVIDSEISGIEDNNALLDSGGTVYGDTKMVRNDYNLPEGLAVIYFKDDEICWCIDGRKIDQPSIVNYNLFKQKIENIIAEDFSLFFEEYLELRSE